MTIAPSWYQGGPSHRLVVRTGAPFYLRVGDPAIGDDGLWLVLRRRGLPLPLHSSPEGQASEWRAILRFARGEHGDSGRCTFRRLGALADPGESIVTLYSPRNAKHRRDYLRVPRHWLVGLLGSIGALA